MFDSSPALLALLSTLANPTYDDCCLNALLRGDPHCTGAHHDHFSMRGEHNGIYNVLTASNLSFNAQFEFKMSCSAFAADTLNLTVFIWCEKQLFKLTV